MLYGSKKGQTQRWRAPMPLLTQAELATYPEPTTRDVVPGYVARYWDMMALADKHPRDGPRPVDRPGFEVEFLTVDC